MERRAEGQATHLIESEPDGEHASPAIALAVGQSDGTLGRPEDACAVGESV